MRCRRDFEICIDIEGQRYNGRLSTGLMFKFLEEITRQGNIIVLADYIVNAVRLID